jgi:hypothetical protein
VPRHVPRVDTRQANVSLRRFEDSADLEAADGHEQAVAELCQLRAVLGRAIVETFGRRDAARAAIGGDGFCLSVGNPLEQLQQLLSMGFAKTKTAPIGAVFTQHHLLAEATSHERKRRQPKAE